MNKQTSNWCFTLNNYTEEEVTAIQGLDVKYIIYGKEVGESGTPHLQGYVNLARSQKLSYVSKLISRAHWEPCNGSPQQNIDYCSKQGDVWFKGIAPFERLSTGQRKGGKRTMEEWDEVVKKAKAGDVDGIDSDIQLKYYRTLKQMAKDYAPRPPDMDVDADWKGILWIYGEPGCGKSRYVRETWSADEIFAKGPNKWWDGYSGQKIVLIDDYPKDGKYLGYYIKIWGDRYSFEVENKGGKMNVRPERLVITSNYLPEEIWEDRIELAAIMRRTEVVYM